MSFNVKINRLFFGLALLQLTWHNPTIDSNTKIQKENIEADKIEESSGNDVKKVADEQPEELPVDEDEEEDEDTHSWRRR